MKIFVNGKLAKIKKGSSFEFVAENRSFTGADGYTLSISFPLKGCPDNVAIFGHINRTDVAKGVLKFDCEIQDVNFSKVGVITIVEINDIEVKAQFLEGRSADNFHTSLDELYINELSLNSNCLPQAVERGAGTPAVDWAEYSVGHDYITIPWVNNTSGNIQNEVIYQDGAYYFHPDCKGTSRMFYLIAVVKGICSKIGLTPEFDEWETHPQLKNLVICNALPWAWEIMNAARLLPHWTVMEFFEKLELFLGGVFNIDYKHNRIRFNFAENADEAAGVEFINKIVDAYTAELTEEDESKYIGSALLRYAEESHLMQKFYSCPLFIKQNEDLIIRYDSFSSIEGVLNAKADFPETTSDYIAVTMNEPYDRILYARDIDEYFIFRLLEMSEANGEKFPVYTLQSVNAFADINSDESLSNEVELDFIPVCIEHTEECKGNCVYIEVPEYNETGTNDVAEEDKTQYQPNTEVVLNKTENKETAEYFSKIHLGIWDSSIDFLGKLPHPIIDDVTIVSLPTKVVDGKIVYPKFHVYRHDTSLRIRHRSASYSYRKINPYDKYQFTFIADRIPNVRSIFLIKGKKYLCEKITATFNENGMSQLLKGSFYQLEN